MLGAERLRAPRRRASWEDAIYDLLVIGGGINGAGIARDAAGRGLGVLLCEKGDLAEATSSSSTKLIHGGLRYLEYYEFRLVREALAERERLLEIAPHIIWPLRFVLPHDKGLRPAWMLRLGLFLYDHLARLRTLPGSKSVDLRNSPFGAPLQERLVKGFLYSDCWVEDSRLVVLNAMDAHARGAEIRTRTLVASARRDGDAWVATLRGERGDETVRARIIVNAAGPWVSDTLAGTLGINAKAAVRLVKGSHIVHQAALRGRSRLHSAETPTSGSSSRFPTSATFTLIGHDRRGPHVAEPRPVPHLARGDGPTSARAVDRFFKRPIAPEGRGLELFRRPGRSTTMPRRTPRR